MDTQSNFINKILQTTGAGEFTETIYNVPKLKQDEIQVKSIFTGICRSDIDMMTGSFGPLPLHMQGHEGLGQVIAIGPKVDDVKIGDYVATRGEPAYADVYNAKAEEYVKVPEPHPRYIVEPVACGINIVIQPFNEILIRSGKDKRMLILGTGFLAWVAYSLIKIYNLEFNIDVIGSSNKDQWQKVTELKSEPCGKYDVVIDLNNSDLSFNSDLFNNEGLLIMGTQKQITTDFANLLWKACTVIFPSPRTKKFYNCMHDAVFLIQTGKLHVDSFWTKGYNRYSQWQQAFSDGLDRPKNYSRGYLTWL